MTTPVPPLAVSQPAAEALPPGPYVLLPSCDATASGSEGAQVRLVRGRAVLFFCGHHASRHELALIAAGWRVTDDNRRFLS